ncbi:MAG: hypothetical protein GQ576_00415 [Methanococcoides sp.]|nr:hypothetical protein [Methanococcoides sp.]
MREYEEIQVALDVLKVKMSNAAKCKKSNVNVVKGQIKALEWVLNNHKTSKKSKPKHTGTPTVGCCPELTEVYRRPMRSQY